MRHYFLIIVGLKLVFTIILRNSKYYDYSAMFTKQMIGRFMKNKLTTIYFINYKTCLIKCGLHEKCEAINYNEDEEICELLQIYSIDNLHTDVDQNKKKWKFVYTADLEDYFLDYCLQFPPYKVLQENSLKVFGQSQQMCFCLYESLCYLANGEVAKNLAFGKKTDMLSSYDLNHGSFRLTDGEYWLTAYDGHRAAATKEENNPWMDVYLGDMAKIYMIRVVNRMGFAGLRFESISILLRVHNPSISGDFTETCLEDMATSEMDIRIYCKQESNIGNAVRITRKRDHVIVNVQELEVYGYFLEGKT